MSKERFTILILIVLLLWFGKAIVGIENERYALLLGSCGEVDVAVAETVVERGKCLRTVQTRTSPFWHLLYGLGVL